mmetsp:Transcript_36858/g.110490  ORF Transcript_36858/g.110490 Transcript_36858/m.110490 type:complete len:510 (-) Transcript_36858:186-1715(-)
MRLTFPHPISSPSHPELVLPKRRLGSKQSETVNERSTNGSIGCAESVAAVTSLLVSVKDKAETYPRIDTDESYTLTIPHCGGAGQLFASTVNGVLRGLETFSQLVVFDYDAAEYGLTVGLPISISDKPRFLHRGLMIDTARHFLPVKAIMRIVDSMSFAKLNVLHWHVSDTQSFPLQLESRPDLWKGSFSKSERYLKDEVRLVVEHARTRGIRVIPEFDVPGHAASWCVGYPSVCPSDPDCSQPLNVARDDTFNLLEDIISECVGKATNEDLNSAGASSSLFPDEFFHLGGDEVNTGCWTKDSEISAWLKSKNMSADDGYAYFVHRASSIAISNGRRPVQWSEVYDHFKTRLDKETIVHIWKSVTNVTEVAADGYDILINVGDSPNNWYLDHLKVPWDKVYENDPCSNIPVDRPDLCSKVLGGHGEMWGETVDASDIEATIWPRAAAIAERLWSPREKTSDAKAAQHRIEAFRCLLNARGIGAAPVNNAEARSAPNGPGSCFDQRRRVL